jgi:hypothetical protein
LLGRRRIAVGDGDRRAGEGLSNGAANTGAGAGDQGNGTVQSEDVGIVH